MGALAMKEPDKPGWIVSRNPATGEVLGEVRDLGAEDVRAAVEGARSAQRDWGQRSVRERAEAVGRFRDAIVRQAAELCELISRETGKTRHEALMMEVVAVSDLATYFVKRAPKILEPHTIPMHLIKHRGSYVHYAPRGVVGIISPWNFPFGIAAGELVMALIAGNGVVHKPSEVTPLIAVRTKEIYDAVGLPGDLFQVITGRGPAGAAMIDAGIDYCVFTGSTATGKKVAAACGERLIPCTMELGGKAPAVICADADVERTARALVWGAFANQGQVCAGIERVYAHQAIHDELVDRVVALTEQLRQGDPSGTATVDAGSMTWERQVEIVEERIKAAVDAGARVRTGGKRKGAGLSFQPTVLTECRQDMDVMRKEIFGPVLPIMKVGDEEEAVRLANDSHLGLCGYVYTDDKQKGQRLAERLEVGTAMVNETMISFAMPETPWGGVKQSGFGRTHSDDGLRELCQLRHVNYDRLALKREPWWYPYSDKVYKQSLKMLRWLFR
jgi:succinate-semialdehyde dehydrogenase/glutarate-semialdehyde dehydrogenase